MDRFATDEDGAMTILGMIIFVMILVAGGIAIDIMRSEVDRANLQSTMDRAVLAAASTNEPNEAAEVVRNYLHAAGLPEDTVRVTMLEDLNGFKSVSLSAQSQVDSLFLGMLGQEELVQPLSASAEQEYVELEVSLVLDISGSMRNAKIASLKREAKQFVTDLLDGKRKDLTTVSIVPYNSMVNLGPTLAKYVPITQDHDLSYCVTFPLSHFSTTQIAPDGFPQVMERMPFFDQETGTSNVAGAVPIPHCIADTKGDIYTPEAFPNTRGQVVAWSNDVVELHNAIEALTVGEFTATDLGAKVGAYLLDPSAQPVLASMALNNLVEPQFVGRPSDWDTPSVRKVLVIMTDGANTEQWNIKSDRRRGPSGIYVYRDPDAFEDGEDNPAFDPIVLIPDDVDDTDENGDLVNTCDPAIADMLDPETFLPLFSLLDHDNCDGRKGKFSVSEPAEGDPTDPWWLAPRLDDVFEQIDGTETTGLRFSVRNRVDGQDNFYIPHLHEYHDTPFGGEEAYQLSYTELWATYTPNYIGNRILRHSWSERVNDTTRSHYRYAVEKTHDRDVKLTYTDAITGEVTVGETLADTALLDLCDAATFQGRMEVYTIAFSAGENAERIMNDCIKNKPNSKFYAVQNITGNDAGATDGGLAQAFRDILASITDLTLTE